MFEVIGWTKFIEEDVFAEGCLPETSACHSDHNMRFNASTIDDIIKTLMSFTGCDDRFAVMLDACDENGRIDIQIMENAHGYAASKDELEAWRKGECRLWLAEYVFRVEQVERRTIALAA